MAGTRLRRGSDIDGPPNGLRRQIESNVVSNQRKNSERYPPLNGVRSTEFGVRVPVRMVNLEGRLPLYRVLAR